MNSKEITWNLNHLKSCLKVCNNILYIRKWDAFIPKIACFFHSILSIETYNSYLLYLNSQINLQNCFTKSEQGSLIINIAPFCSK